MHRNIQARPPSTSSIHSVLHKSVVVWAVRRSPLFRRTLTFFWQHQNDVCSVYAYSYPTEFLPHDILIHAPDMHTRNARTEIIVTHTWPKVVCMQGHGMDGYIMTRRLHLRITPEKEFNILLQPPSHKWYKQSIFVLDPDLSCARTLVCSCALSLRRAERDV